MKRHGRVAFTLVELLVVIAVVALLVALLLPAVQAARESGRRASCSNNLRQLGIAIHQYHDAAGSFPPGNVTLSEGICYGSALPGVGFPSEDGANWAIALLPYLEEQSLYEQYDFGDYNEAKQNRAVREAQVAVYVCPSDLPADELLVPASGPACVPALNLPYRPGSYRAMSGRSDGTKFLDSAAIINYPRRWRGPIHTVGIRGFTVERIRHVADGLASTIMLGESTTRTNPTFRTFWAYSYSHYSLSAATPQERIMRADYNSCAAEDQSGADLPCRRGWGSLHPAGAHFLLCDGSVRLFSLDLDMKLFAELATIDGGEVVGALPE